MAKRRAQARLSEREDEDQGVLGRPPTPDSDLTWLLHRAAQRMRAAIGHEAERHGLHLRDYIVISALCMQANLTQLELGKALGLDKTTLMLLLDRLEKKRLVTRRPDPRDRRARIPEVTSAGRAVRGKVATACADVEAKMVAGFASGGQRSLRIMLCQLIGEGEDKGSCL
jgi:DNA-binding MarR family transcriptional regulator